MECTSPGSRQLSFTCRAAQIQFTPTWIFPDGERRSGVQSLQQVSTKTGCRCHENRPISAVGALYCRGRSVGVSLRSHFSTSATDYCDLSQTFNCDLVNRSTYSTVHGVPVAVLGIFGYLLLFALSWRTTRRTARFRFVASLIGMVFALYLAYVEAYVLAVWCLLCVGSMVSISAITLLSGIDLFQTRRLPAIDAHAGGFIRNGRTTSVYNNIAEPRKIQEDKTT